MADSAPAPTSLADQVVAFGRVLRRAGLKIGSGQIIDALRAVEAVGVARRDDVYQALFGVFVQRREDVEVFDEAFRLFWRTSSDVAALLSMLLPHTPVPPEVPKQQTRVRQALDEPDARPKPRPEEEREVEVELVASYSPSEALRQKDFAAFTAEEIEEAKVFLQRLRWPVEPMRVRRHTLREKGRRLHLRATLRQGLRDFGEFAELRRQGPKRKQRPLVVLCDISGSMEPYARMLLHFMHALTDGMRRAESFVFGTRLTRITRYLRRRDVDAALDAVTAHVQDWSGGTRIGEAVRTFNYYWLRRVLRSGGVVLIISDGCDRGDPAVLGREMERLARNCHRLFWLNPLLGYAAYEPLTRGMQAALPHLDAFLPVHNLDALEDLAHALAALDGPRSARTRHRRPAERFRPGETTDDGRRTTEAAAIPPPRRP